ncbi:MAG: type 3 dihydrofolate reductase [Gammaproteobacteria bacterium]|jgi:dihydrofolate reductase|nr:type 3 dihydrofolate reductase [Gammaproteobacteria bacterium]MBT4075384.1 type 3 dihydrofolate reductase [Gammaproteobacteria bacterium]MBT4194709.1 type 3 dihydrofolate reductase [Gammaproteobacteria bacterium]MBT4449701.1 type 3 dihydrofolate reductase [Gammaproteobacteria bacterium]MBT4863254.1 type 3 dihydrofolate reductase [Gammaproteobacteria bacterium]
MTSLSIISAMDENNLIGDKNTLPWHIPADFAYFKKTTMGKPVLMGRKTYESIGKPLPGRRNIIISRNSSYQAEGCEITDSIQAAIELVSDHAEVMMLGGASLYEQTLTLADTLYITEVHHQFSGDTWFPAINPDDWKETWREEHPSDERNKFPYAFVKYLRQNQ